MPDSPKVPVGLMALITILPFVALVMLYGKTAAEQHWYRFPSLVLVPLLSVVSGALLALYLAGVRLTPARPISARETR